MRSRDTAVIILGAAERVYERSGRAGLTMRAVAAEAGITPTAIYRHFADRADLDRKLLERARRRLGAHLFDGIAGRDALARLWSCGDAYVRFCVESPQLYRLLFLDPSGGGRPDVDALAAGEESAAPFRFMIDRIREAMDAGFLRRDDPGRVALSVWAHIHGLCCLALAGRVPPDRLAGVARASLGDLLDGIRARGDAGQAPASPSSKEEHP